MDKRKSLLNVSVSLFFKIVSMLMALLVKVVLIRVCGNEINGLNMLYLSIIGFMSVIDLGVGSAITFCMYRPIVEGDTDQVSALYHLFRKSYWLFGSLIFACGCALTPFIHVFVKEPVIVDANIYLSFFLMLLSVVLTYVYSAKISLFNAYKNNYIATSITSGGVILQQVLQIVVLLVTHSFEGYLICRIAAVLAQWGVTETVSRKKYAHVISGRQRVNEETKTVLARSIKAMFMHKVGMLMVNKADNIIISLCIGIVVLGKYSNYIMISDAMSGVLEMIFLSLTSVIGHLYVETDTRTSGRYCSAFHVVNFVLGMFFYLGYYAVIEELIILLFGADLVSERSVALVVSVNGFVQFLRKSTFMFREATGTFYEDRWKPLVEGVFNIILSVILAKHIGVTGVIVATIITNLLICHVIEPYVLYRYAFAQSPRTHYVRNYCFMLVFVAAIWIFEHLRIETQAPFLGLMVNGCISMAVSAVVCIIVLLVFRTTTKDIMKLILRRNDAST